MPPLNKLPSTSVFDTVIEGAACAAITYVLFGLLVHSRTTPVVITQDRQLLLNAHKLPSYFKAKEVLLTPVRNQLGCSSCWAFSIAEVLADTISLRTGGKWREHLSPQYLLSCTNIHFGCKNGGSPEDVWPILTQEGLPLEKDCLYVAAVTPCQAISSDALRIRTIEGTSIDICTDPATALPGFKQKVIDENVMNMKRALLQYGPICGTLRITKELYEYKGDSIYKDNPASKTLGGHAVEVVGWSDKNANTHEPGFNDAYWIIRNSYSTAWGGLLYGFAYIAAGSNTAWIESRASICQIEMPEHLKAAENAHNIWNSFFTSYSEYVSDPNKQNFIDEDRKRFLDDLHKARAAAAQSKNTMTFR